MGQWAPDMMHDDPCWQVRIEGYDPRTEAGTEAVLLVGNGFSGVRGGLEEGPAESIPRTFIAGLFDRVHAKRSSPDSINQAPRLVTAPD